MQGEKRTCLRRGPAANSNFLGDYLTSEGQAADLDLEMIADAGLVPDA